MRELDNWLDTYIEYVENTESAKVFHKWVGISLLAAVLRKKYWFKFGRFKIYSNLYIVLIAEPGIARKTQAISYGTNLLNEIPGINISADTITREALLLDLEESIDEAELPDGTMFKHASMTVRSREFESFLGQKKENTKMLVMLTDLFDCEEIPFRYRTKHEGYNVIPSVFFNLIGATTPESLASSLPVVAIGGGLTSRIIFIWADDKEKKVAIPEDLKPYLTEPLIRDLSIISRLVGEVTFDAKARKEWLRWYNIYEERDPQRICKDPAFNSWYTRKPLFAIKLAMILSAAESNTTELKWESFEKALALLVSTEEDMQKTFSAIGRSEITADVDLVKNIIRKYSKISERNLLQLVWRDIDAKKFDNVISTILRSGSARGEYLQKGGNPQMWYFWNKNG